MRGGLSPFSGLICEIVDSVGQGNFTLILPGRVHPYKRLMGMCHWMGSHFHDWIDYYGVTFSTELLEWGRTFLDFWGKTVLHIYG